SGEKMYDCAPVEFISMIKNAKAVCTSSFHGTAFSIIMGTPFYVEMASGTYDSRIARLLSVTGNIESAVNCEADKIQKSEKNLQEIVELSKAKVKDWII
ncbi:MAG: polysaccharide pyruvyl transferase family protein, partial [Clostridia bacterium]|nr:polysaccharide pyruvyl transferase family protein [Clostridia bacterium]